MDLNEALIAVKPLDEAAMAQSKKKWDNIAKPLNSLGALELTVIKLAGILGTADVRLAKRALVVMCADHGVVAQNVTQSDSSVTATVSENFTKGRTTVCAMAQHIGADVFPVDVGIKANIDVPGLLNKKIMNGTNDMTQTAAMSREQAVAAIEVGINMAVGLKAKGYDIMATGEMGIGNTTASAAIAVALFDHAASEVTGRGAGLDAGGLKRKVAAIEKAIARNKPNKHDALDVLSKVGGLEIAGMTGLFIGGAAVGMPVMVDGFISGISAVIASKLCPLCKAYMVVSHMSAEPAGKMVLDQLQFLPLVTAGMCLGEGTGAMAALAIIDMAVSVYHDAATFDEVAMEAYVDLRTCGQ